MKKSIFIAFVLISVVTLAFSFLPINAVQAREDTTITLDVRNRTGDIVSLKLVDGNGNVSWFVFQTGLTPISLPEDLYTYYASTVCGNRTGTFNLNVAKELLFDCHGGSGDTLGVTLWRPVGTPACGTYTWWVTTEGGGFWWPDGPTSDIPGDWELRCTDGISVSFPS